MAGDGGLQLERDVMGKRQKGDLRVRSGKTPVPTPFNYPGKSHRDYKSNNINNPVQWPESEKHTQKNGSCVGISLVEKLPRKQQLLGWC